MQIILIGDVKDNAASMIRRPCSSCLLLLLLPLQAFAAPYYGMQFSYLPISKEPDNLKGYQIMASYDPNCFQWRAFNVYFDGGYSHLWITETTRYRKLDILSAAPVVRYMFREHFHIRPFLELSIGIAYLTKTRIGNRNLGIHFSFQDRAGIGIVIGHQQQLALGVHAVHYSNAKISSQNSGVTVPLAIDISYRFS